MEVEALTPFRLQPTNLTVQDLLHLRLGPLRLL